MPVENFPMYSILARQGLPLRGDGAGEEDGNFVQVCQFLGYGNSSFSNWLGKDTNKYTGHDMQNEMLQVMALRILRDITANLQSTKYCIMFDETSDISTQEQVVVVMRWVDSNLDVHEDFLGLHTTHSIDANTLVAIIHDVPEPQV